MRVPQLTIGRIGWAALALGGLLGAWRIERTFIEDDNFRKASQTLYRSGQLRADEWDETLDQAKYRTVINLRGAKPDSSWYRQETQFASQKGLAHFDFALSADVEPSIEQMNEIIAVMRDAPKPILIHCKNGSDRSGLVAALYLNAVEGVPQPAASRQLSLWYGHFPWLGSRTGAMDAALGRFFGREGKPRPKLADL